MGNLVVKRLLMVIPTAVIVALISFSIIYFSPGNAAEIILTDKNPVGGTNQQTVATYEEKLGLNESFIHLFGKWMKNAFEGDFGDSFKTGNSISKEFSDHVCCTLSLVLIATAIYLLLGFIMGTFSALFKDSVFDRLTGGIAALNLSIPNFWMALLLQWVFAIKLKLLPVFGYEGFKSLILPGLALGIASSSSLARVIRTCMLECLNSPYVLTARAKGLSEGAVLFKHVLKNVLLPVITLSGMKTARLLGGSVIIESIFGLPGVGNYLLNAISLKDFPAISGFIFLIGIMIIVINFMVDLSYGIIDPRVRDVRR